MIKYIYYKLLPTMILFMSTSNIVLAKGENWAYNLPEPVSERAQMVLDFHNDWLMPIITIITLFVLALLIYACFKFREKNNPTPSKTTHNAPLEFAWTIIPALILAVLFIPSMKLHYFSEEIPESDITIKITGYQWYWNYGYPDEGDLNFDSYLIADEDLTEEQKKYRLMLVDNPLVVPVGKNIRIQMTSGDVIHNWAVSDFGVRLDAVPGRLNETWVNVKKEGRYFGFCSELCGTGHAYMPITVDVVSEEKFQQWLKKAKTEFASSSITKDSNISLASR